MRFEQCQYHEDQSGQEPETVGRCGLADCRARIVDIDIGIVRVLMGCCRMLAMVMGRFECCRLFERRHRTAIRVGHMEMQSQDSGCAESQAEDEDGREPVGHRAILA